MTIGLLQLWSCDFTAWNLFVETTEQLDEWLNCDRLVVVVVVVVQVLSSSSVSVKSMTSVLLDVGISEKQF